MWADGPAGCNFRTWDMTEAVRRARPDSGAWSKSRRSCRPSSADLAEVKNKKMQKKYKYSKVRRYDDLHRHLSAVPAIASMVPENARRAVPFYNKKGKGRGKEGGRKENG